MINDLDRPTPVDAFKLDPIAAFVDFDFPPIVLTGADFDEFFGLANQDIFFEFRATMS